MEENKGSGLKSAFDLAMERMAQKDGGLVVLSEDQKKAIANVAQKTKAKIAELEIMFDQKLEAVKAGGDEKKIKEVEDLKAREIGKVRNAEAREKETIRKGQ